MRRARPGRRVRRARRMRRERPAGEVPPAGLSRVSWSFPFLGLLGIVLVGLMRHTNCLAT